jgi:OPA family glycerol-3-phosphate transporter-like MFS transporter
VERRAQRRRRPGGETRAAIGVLLFHDWGAKFYAPRRGGPRRDLIAWLLRDTPQSCGLPPIEAYKNDYPPTTPRPTSRPCRSRRSFFGYVLNNKYLWAIAVANAFVYFVRYGVVDWMPTYLQTAKGFSFQQSSYAWAAFEFAGIPGTICAAGCRTRSSRAGARRRRSSSWRSPCSGSSSTD